MKKRLFLVLLALCGCVATVFAENPPVPINDRGAIKPQEAIAYMKATPNLVIVDVADLSEYDARHFPGAIHIPARQIPARYSEIPEGQPVIVHCRLGKKAPKAYKELRKLRPDITEIYYIDGVPDFEGYGNYTDTE